MITVAVGSKNPVKVAAVRQAFKKVWPEETVVVKGYATASGVPDQPMSPKETIQGARNRAQRARKTSNVAYGVGLENGLHKIEGQWFDYAWVVVVDKNGQEGIGATQKIHVPHSIMQHIHQGKELGVVTDELFSLTQSKKGIGYFGVATKGYITRRKSLTDGVIMALSRFLIPDVFQKP